VSSPTSSVGDSCANQTDPVRATSEATDMPKASSELGLIEIDQDVDPIEIDLGLENCRGDFSFLRELLESFVPDVVQKVPEMMSALLAGNTEQVGFAAHRLRGSAAIVGATTLDKLLANLEKMLPPKGSSTDCVNILESMQKQTRLIYEYLAEIGIPLDESLEELEAKAAQETVANPPQQAPAALEYTALDPPSGDSLPEVPSQPPHSPSPSFRDTPQQHQETPRLLSPQATPCDYDEATLQICSLQASKTSLEETNKIQRDRIEELESMLSKGDQTVSKSVLGGGWFSQDAEMFAFLKELRLGHYAHYFESNGISIGLLKVMSDKERADVLRSIGVRAVGARVAINHAFMDMDR